MFRIILISRLSLPLRWRHHGCYGVSNHQPHDCVLNRLFRRRSMNTSKLRVTGLCEGNSPGTGEFPAQMASNVENVSIWWRDHGYSRSNVGARDMHKVFHSNPYSLWLSSKPSTAHLKQCAHCVVLVTVLWSLLHWGLTIWQQQHEAQHNYVHISWSVSRMECSPLWYIGWKKHYMLVCTVRLERPWLFMNIDISVIQNINLYIVEHYMLTRTVGQERPWLFMKIKSSVIQNINLLTPCGSFIIDEEIWKYFHSFLSILFYTAEWGIHVHFDNKATAD